MSLLTSMHWGVYEVDTSSGETPALKPFRSDPAPSPIGLYALSDAVQRTRVGKPAVRRSWLEGGPGSRPELRGKEPFIEVSWQEAEALVAGELDRVRTAYGNQAIFGGSYGWASAGRFHHAQSQIHRFLNSLGGYVRHTDSYSLGAGRVLMPHIIASIDELFVSHTQWDVLEANTELFVAFGGVPLKNTQVAGGGASEHRVPEALFRMAERGVRFVNISPVCDNLEAGDAVEWLPLRPNTDTALMLGIAHTLSQEGLHDVDFLERYAQGFQAFERYLLGSVDGQAKDADWAGAICDVSAERIRCLAREMASKRTVVNVAFALQRAHHGEQPFWMAVTLAAMLGQLGTPGGGFGLYGAINTMGSPHPRFKGPTLDQGSNAVHAFIPVARIADCLLNPGASFEYNGGTYHYPDIRLVYWAGGNPFHHHQDLHRLVKAWQRPETIVVHEQFWTATAKLSDVVLPATTTLERDDIGYATRARFMIAMHQVAKVQGEARDDFDIFLGLAERLDAGSVFGEGRSKRAWLEKLYSEARERAEEAGVDLPAFEEFWQQGQAEIVSGAEPTVFLRDFRADPERHPLSTPSGKIEIFSERIANFGLADCPGHPQWFAPAEWLGADRARHFPLHLLSDQPARRLHSQLDPSPYSQADKILGRQPISLASIDARSRGISDGDIVRVFNDRGSCLAGARVTDDIRTGVVRLSTGAWFDPETVDDRTGVEKHGNPNVLTLDIGASPLSQGCVAQTCLVEVEKFSEELPQITAHDPPQFTVRRDEDL